MTDKKTWSLTDPPEEPQARGDATPLLVPKPVDPVGGGDETTGATTSEGGDRGSPEPFHREPVVMGNPKGSRYSAGPSQGPILMGNPKGSRYTTGPSLLGQDEDVLEHSRRRRKVLALVLFGLALAAVAAFVWMRRG
ncbi:hypothetical protein [Polyangium mundeleinium]|uniref:Uncharacterized protein n=1 Tax=Polyangium mundeleinium TaxID=2995306 RepID=A0ABT5EZE1_9BACT|nr:hypothetical protein [Polyangium mundeleinium]MDC0747180.1 hypothetical protein [Polyangium mundeleinium]